jgi:Protein of unknown function (DUF3489)
MTNAETNDKAATVAEQGAHVASEKVSLKKGATRKKGALVGRKTTKRGKTKVATLKKAAESRKKAANRTAAKQPSSLRAESKGSKILEMIGRAKGATLTEIMKATGWQAHSVRGFLSTASKKSGIKVESTKEEDGGRTYKITN